MVVFAVLLYVFQSPGKLVVEVCTETLPGSAPRKPQPQAVLGGAPFSRDFHQVSCTQDSPLGPHWSLHPEASLLMFVLVVSQQASP